MHDSWGIRRDPQRMISGEFASRLKLLAIHERDPDGIRWGPHSGLSEHVLIAQSFMQHMHDSRGDPTGSATNNFERIRISLIVLAIHERDPDGIRWGQQSGLSEHVLIA